MIELPDGRVEVITGCMFSGKTDEMLRRIRRAQYANKTVQLFTPAVDDRDGKDTIGTHDSLTQSATVVDVESSLDSLRTIDSTVDIIGIDEGNFFNNNLVPVVDSLAENHRVIVTGIDQTFRGEPFPPMNNLLAIADSVTKLSAICLQCGNQATRTQRLIDGEPAPSSSPTVLVGGEETYEARCRGCHSVPK